MRYFFLKLGKGNSLADRFLGSAVAGELATVAVFYGMSSIVDCRSGKQGADARDFCLAADVSNRPLTRIIVIHRHLFYVLEPIGEIHDGAPEPNENGDLHTLKIMPVRIIGRRPLGDIPHLLASMGSNAWWIRGTFRSIGHDTVGMPRNWSRWEHQTAIEHTLGTTDISSHLHPEIEQRPALLLCLLSAVELETLVAKLGEEAGFFVPAYRGGTMKDIDIIACNDGTSDLGFGPLSVPARGHITIQVKSWMAKTPDHTDGSLLVALGLKPSERGRWRWDAETLWHTIQESTATRGWLKRSLHWLPVQVRDLI